MVKLKFQQGKFKQSDKIKEMLFDIKNRFFNFKKARALAWKNRTNCGEHHFAFKLIFNSWVSEIV